MAQNVVGCAIARQGHEAGLRVGGTDADPALVQAIGLAQKLHEAANLLGQVLAVVDERRLVVSAAECL